MTADPHQPPRPGTGKIADTKRLPARQPGHTLPFPARPTRRHPDPALLARVLRGLHRLPDTQP